MKDPHPLIERRLVDALVRRRLRGGVEVMSVKCAGHSFVGEVCGRRKQGAAYGYTHLVGLPPDPGHTRGHARDAPHPPQEGVGDHAEGHQALLRGAHRARAARRRDRPAAVARRLGVWNTKVFEPMETAGWQYSIGVRMIKTVRQAVEAIPEHDWQRIDYPDEGEAQIAETTYGGRRLIIRRTRLLGAQAELWPDWRHFCFVTNRGEELALVEAEH